MLSQGIMKKVTYILLLFAMIAITAFTESGSAEAQITDTMNINAVLRVSPFRLEIVPPSSGVSFYRNGIVFLSSSRSESRMLDSHTSFGTVETYYAGLIDSTTGRQEPFSESIRWDFPAEAMTFSSDYSEMYYTKRPSGREPEKIYMAKYQEGKNDSYDWISEKQPLSFCSDKSVYTHPALFADGEKMIFASDRKESIGGLDLFISYREGSGWSAPINLGNLINSQGNEMYPFVDQNNNLYFSSDGLGGMGGYDIFICRYNGRGWNKPVNLTSVINTSDDDIAFALSRLDNRTAFYSQRPGYGNRQPRLHMIRLRDQYALNRFTGLSQAFGYLAQAAVITTEETIPIAGIGSESVRPPEVSQETEVRKPEIIKESETGKVAEVKPASVPAKDIPEEVSQETAPVIRTETVQPSADEIIYRVQYLSVSKPRGTSEITVEGRTYNTYEYYYNGVYRSCAGEFRTPGAAVTLQNAMKRQGYSDAFIVAFRNNERVTGLPQPASSQPAGVQPQAVAVKTPVRTAPAQAASPDGIIYRVQFASVNQTGTIPEINAGGITYPIFEYTYAGAIRVCAGEFSSREDAAALQRVLKAGRYPDAFVVAFRNNERITNPATP